MAVRLVNGFRCCTVTPSPTALRCCLRHHNHLHFHSSTCFSISRRIRCRRISFGYEAVRRYSAQSLVDMVMEELDSIRKRGIARASIKLGLGTSDQLIENKPGKKTLQKGLLLEFKKDSERVLLAVVQKPDGKKNWMVSDQVLMKQLLPCVE